MRFEVLPGLPPYGPMAVSFTENGQSEYREGLVVRFCPKGSEPWIGNFLGGMSGCTIVLDHPNETDVIVVANGEVCVVNPESRALHGRFGADIQEVIPLPSLRSVVFRGTTDIAALVADNSGWRSPRISWDGFRDIEVNGTELSGKAYTPIGDVWVPFKLDLLTGHCRNAIYQSNTQGAIRLTE
jgi:hypothetical protein